MISGSGEEGEGNNKNANIEVFKAVNTRDLYLCITYSCFLLTLKVRCRRGNVVLFMCMFRQYSNAS